ncbi:MAG: hypothetical protein ACRDD8_16085 [Bacteroidales bacterium]
MAISVEQALSLAVSSSGYLNTINSVEKILFINDEESRDKVRELRNQTGPLDRKEAIKEVSTIISTAVENGKTRQENAIQAILMIANASQKKKKRR